MLTLRIVVDTPIRSKTDISCRGFLQTGSRARSLVKFFGTTDRVDRNIHRALDQGLFISGQCGLAGLNGTVILLP
jgi:hypothetical protein